jgi:DNA-binding FadR family transcriptional regulator
MLIARRSRAKIAQDPFRMGAQLPTEHALCRCYRLSRFIVREAMSMLFRRRPIALPTASASRTCWTPS